MPTYERYLAVFDVDTAPAISNIDKLLATTRSALRQIRADIASGALPANQQLAAEQAVATRAASNPAYTEVPSNILQKGSEADIDRAGTISKIKQSALDRVGISQALLDDPIFKISSATAQVNNTRVGAQINAKANAELLKYADELGLSIASEKILNAATNKVASSLLLKDEQYKTDTVQGNVNAARENAEITARTNSELLQYAAELGAAKVSTERLNTATNLAANELLIDTRKVLPPDRDASGHFVKGTFGRENPNYGGLTSLGQEVTGENAQESITSQRLAVQNQLAQNRLVTQRDIEERAQATAERKAFDAREQVELQGILEADGKLRANLAQAAVAAERVKALQQVANAEQYTAGDRNLIAGGAAADKVSSAEQTIANNNALLESTAILGEEVSSRKQLAETIKLNSLAQEQNVSVIRDSEGRVQIQATAEGENVVVLEELTAAERGAVVAVLKKAEADEEASVAARLRREGDQAGINAAALRSLEEKAYAEQLNIAKKRLIESNPELSAYYNTGTGFQRGLARLRSTSTGAPVAASDQPTFSQYIGQQALRTASFAVSGVAFFGAFQGVKTLLDTAKELQVTFATIQQQFVDLGQADQFAGFRQSILDLSTATGTSAQEIATVAFQLKGFFGDTKQAIEGTTTAIEFAKVTGQSLGETVNALTAIAADYNTAATQAGQKAQSNVQIFDEVTNSALGIQERFGVLAKDTVSFLGDFAPVAAQYGVTLKQAEAIAAVYQQASGRSGSSGAEQFNRILPEIQGAQVQLVALNQQTLGFGDSFNKALAQGNYGEVLDQLIRKWGTLDKATQNYLLNLLGGSRNAQALVTLGNLGPKYVAEENRPASDDTGKRAKYFKDVQDTLAVTLSRLGQSFKELGLEIFDSGLGTALQDLAAVAETFAKALGLVLGEFNALPGPMKTVITQGAALLLILKGLSALGQLSLIQGIAGGGLSAGLGKLAPGALFGGETSAVGGAASGFGVPFAAGSGTAVLSGGGGGVLGGLSAALPVIAPVTAAILTAKAINDVKNFNDYTDRASQALITQYQDVSDAELQKRISEQSNIVPFQVQSTQHIFGTPFDVPIPGASTINATLSHFGIGIHNPAKVAQVDVQQLRQTKPEAQGLQSLGKDQLGQLLQGFKDDAGASSNAQDLSVSLINDISRHGTKDDQDKKNLDAFVYYVEQRHKAVRGAIDAATHNAAKDQAQAAHLVAITGDKGQRLEHLDQSVQDVVAAFQSGDASSSQVVAAYDREIRTYETLVKYSSGDPAFAKKLQQDKIARSKFYAASLDATSKNIRDIERATTGQEDYTGEINQDIQKLRDPRYTSPAARAANIAELFNLYGQVYKEQAANATTFAQTLDLATNGIKIDPTVAREAIAQSLTANNLAWQTFIQSAKDTGTIPNGFTNSVVSYAQKFNISVGQAAREILTARLKTVQAEVIVAEASGASAADLNALLKEEDNLRAAIRGVGNRFKGIHVPGTITGPPDLSGISSEQALKDAQAQGDPQKIADDQVAAAQQQVTTLNAYADKHPNSDYVKNGQYTKDLQAAQVQILQGTTAQGDALASIAQANAGLIEAENAYDPITAARAQLAAADAQLANAHGVAERLQAQTAIINANKAIEDAIQEQAHARTDLLVAIANSHGQTVKAAQLSEQSAEQDVRDLIARGAKPGSAPVLEAQAKTVSAIAAVENARVQDKESTIEFNLAVKKISTAQAIAQYRTLLASADIIHLGKGAQQDLLRRIYDLKHSLEADLQFNLPTDLKLPTLYEAKRFNQDPGSYTDNRTITITLSANNKLDARAAADTIITEVNKPPRNGPRAKTY